MTTASLWRWRVARGRGRRSACASRRRRRGSLIGEPRCEVGSSTVGGAQPIEALLRKESYVCGARKPFSVRGSTSPRAADRSTYDRLLLRSPEAVLRTSNYVCNSPKPFYAGGTPSAAAAALFPAAGASSSLATRPGRRVDGRTRVASASSPTTRSTAPIAPAMRENASSILGMVPHRPGRIVNADLAIFHRPQRRARKEP